MWRMMASAIVILAILLINEWWWHRKTHGEVSRKFVHITVGSFVAFWPLYMSWHQIELLSLIFVVAVLISKWLNIFAALHSVQRPTWGEIFFGAVVGLAALIAPSVAAYTLALLFMSLADGLAAIVGVKYGAGLAYGVFGARKSLAGTATFFVVACLLLLGYGLSGHFVALAAVPAMLLGSTIIENIAVWGLDNLLVPLGILVLLRHFGG